MLTSRHWQKLSISLSSCLLAHFRHHWLTLTWLLFVQWRGAAWITCIWGLYNSGQKLLCQWDFEYTDCISCRRVIPPPPKKKGCLRYDTKVNLWWWGFNSEELECVEYLFITITPKFSLTWCSSTCYVPSMGQINLFKLLVFYRIVCTKKWNNCTKL